MNPFAQYVKFTALAGQGEKLAQILLSVAKEMNNVDGCLLYVVNTTPESTDIVWVTEVWQSKEEHQASFQLAFSQKALAKGKGLMVNVESIELVPMGGKGMD